VSVGGTGPDGGTLSDGDDVGGGEVVVVGGGGGGGVGTVTAPLRPCSKTFGFG
jgi:hypothetical protein